MTTNIPSISVRIERLKNVYNQRVHDLRKYTDATRPKHINPELSHLNSVLVKPLPSKELRKIVDERRENRQRALKSNAVLLWRGIITFSIPAQQIMSKVIKDEQNKIFYNIAKSIADFLNTDLDSLVVHRDESALHAHFTLIAFTKDGKSLTTVVQPSTLPKLQDIAAEHVAYLGISRGIPKQKRIQMGHDEYEVIHKNVRQLHFDLQQSVDEKKKLVEELEQQIAEKEIAVKALEGKINEFTFRKQRMEQVFVEKKQELENQLKVKADEKNKLLKEIEQIRKNRNDIISKMQQLIPKYSELKEKYKQKLDEIKRLEQEDEERKKEKQKLQQLEIQNQVFMEQLKAYQKYVNNLESILLEVAITEPSLYNRIQGFKEIMERINKRKERTKNTSLGVVR